MYHIPSFSIIRLVILLTLVKCSFEYLSLTLKKSLGYLPLYIRIMLSKLNDSFVPFVGC